MGNDCERTLALWFRKGDAHNVEIVDYHKG